MSQIEVRATTNQISIRKASNNITVTTSRPVITPSILKNEVTATFGQPKNLIVATPVSVAIAVLGNLDGGSFFDNYNYTQAVNGGTF